MGDFKSYNGEGGRQNGGNVSGEQGEKEQSDANLTAMLARALSGKSSGQIWQLILKQAEQGKRDGTLTNADLDNFYAVVAPMVDGIKRKKLKEVIARLKAI